MAKWTVELSEFDLSYVLRSSMKVQIFADFVVEYTLIDDSQVEDRPQGEASELAWILHVGGASNVQDCGAGLILTNIDGVVTEYVLRFGFKASNNQAKYEVLIARLKIVKDLSIKCLRVFTDS